MWNWYIFILCTFIEFDSDGVYYFNYNLDICDFCHKTEGSKHERCLKSLYAQVHEIGTFNNKYQLYK